MNLLLEKPADVSALSPLTLAFVGDSVFDLLVRSELVCEANRPVDTLHKTAARIVCASAQAGGIRRILPLLTEDEEAVFKRGRNAHTGGIPKISRAPIITTQRGLRASSAGFTSRA